MIPDPVHFTWLDLVLIALASIGGCWLWAKLGEFFRGEL